MIYNKLNESLLHTEEENQRDFFKQMFIVDFGIIIKISDDKTYVSVEHATIQTKQGTSGQITQLPKTITDEVEILYLGSSYLRLGYDIAVGDVVLLLGSKDYVSSITGLTTPATADLNSHYRQENLKAIPITSKANVTVNITCDTSGIKIDAGTKDITTIAQNILLGSDSATEQFIKGTTTNTQTDTLLNLIKTHTHTYSGTDSNGDTFSGVTAVPNNAGSMTNPISLSDRIKGV